MSLREEIDQDALEQLDSMAQIVASLYEDKEKRMYLGQEVSELQEAVYNLGVGYMFLYNLLLSTTDSES